MEEGEACRENVSTSRTGGQIIGQPQQNAHSLASSQKASSNAFQDV